MEVYRCFSRQRFESMRVGYLFVGSLAYILLVITLIMRYWDQGILNLVIVLLVAPISFVLYRVTSNIYLVCLAAAIVCGLLSLA